MEHEKVIVKNKIIAFWGEIVKTLSKGGGGGGSGAKLLLKSGAKPS